jgi:hypothetical protein
LLYYFFGIYSLSYLINYIQNQKGFWMLKVVPIAICSLVGLTALILSFGKNPAKPQLDLMPWASGFYNIKVDQGVVALSLHLQENAVPGNSFIAQKNLIYEISNPALKIIALSGVPSFLTRPDHYAKINSELIEDRLKVLNLIEDAHSWNEAKEVMRAYKIRWFIFERDFAPNWAIEVKKFSMQFDSMAILDSHSK